MRCDSVRSSWLESQQDRRGPIKLTTRHGTVKSCGRAGAAMDAAIPKRQRIKQQNRRFILDGARRIFAEQGYDATTIRDIIRTTPLAAGTFYNYFTSKEDVRLALNAEMAAALRPRLSEGRAQAATAEEFLSAFFSAVFALKAETGSRCRKHRSARRLRRSSQRPGKRHRTRSVSAFGSGRPGGGAAGGRR